MRRIAHVKLILRITPAWAGKRSRISELFQRERDYPRVGGEEVPLASLTIFKEGLPPRGRGRGHLAQDFSSLPGITPAWAGKREGIKIIGVKSWDYPRVGGEETINHTNLKVCQGLPPRGRGRA